MKTLIIGAGVTGLAAGIKTGATIFEQSDHAGGICTDYVKDGFRFSNGGPHFLFGKDKGLEYIKTLVEVKEYERNAGVYYNHTFPYPFQQEASFDIQSNSMINEGSFAESLFNTFGKEQCNLFFFPFNNKYTAGLYNDIIPQDAYKSPKTGSGWVNTFCDPVGGLSLLVSKMASQCKIIFNKTATYIDVKNKCVWFGDDPRYYDRLVSTIPLNKCMELCEEKINLPYTSVLVINIGAEPGINFPKEHWLYIPFCKSEFHRVAFYTNVDKQKAPLGKVGLSVEYAFRGEIDSAKIGTEIIKELQDWGWIGDIHTVGVDIVKCAYTWQYNKEDVPNAIQWLKERDIISTGRYGSWRFCGLTESIMMGFNVLGE
jgi:protoporphyrinogen oxidase